MAAEKEAEAARARRGAHAWLTAMRRAQMEFWKYLEYQGQRPEGDPPELPAMPPSVPPKAPVRMQVGRL